jgi:hypothetical protein
MKIQEKEAALQLRREGYSLGEIARVVGVSKSTVSLWTNGLALSSLARARIESRKTAGQRAAQESKRAATARSLAEAREEAASVISQVPKTKKVASAMLSLMYWCEGTKRRNDSEFTFSNSDPLIIGAFMRLLRTAYPIDERKLRVRMHLHEYHDEAAQRAYWSRITAVPAAQFKSTYRKPHTGKTMRPGYPGCVHIRYHDVRLARAVSAVARAFLGGQDMLN